RGRRRARGAAQPRQRRGDQGLYRPTPFRSDSSRGDPPRDRWSQRMSVQTIIYYYRGDIERGPKYEWHRGYSATSESGHVLYPWTTKRACRADAKAQGARAVFVETSDAATPRTGRLGAS